VSFYDNNHAEISSLLNNDLEGEDFNFVRRAFRTTNAGNPASNSLNSSSNSNSNSSNDNELD